MTVRYSLTRLEVVRTYLFAISSSPRISLVVLIICGWPGLVHLATKLSIAHSLVASDVFIVLLWAVCMFFLLLGWVFFRAKTNERILTISDRGIYTEIGKNQGGLSLEQGKGNQGCAELHSAGESQWQCFLHSQSSIR
jgi:hypothetical protein